MKKKQSAMEKRIRAEKERVSKLCGRIVRDAPGRLWEIVETSTGPYANLYRLRRVGGTYEELVSGYELLHYYTPENQEEKSS